MGDVAPLAFGRYELVEKLATGGMAELYRARVLGAHGFEKPLVIKRILPHLAGDDEFVAMFIDEAKITAHLNHPKIVQVHELGTRDDELFIVMEFVDGMDLLTLLKKCKAEKTPLPPPLAVHIVHEVLDALDYAHQAVGPDGLPLGIVHRDISPGNVLVSWRGDVKLADFGIARAAQRQHHTRTGTLKGKYGYMSPEQIVGTPLDRRSDLFSVGVVLAELLLFRRLFVAPSELEVLLMVRDAKLERLHEHGAHIDRGLLAIIETSLEREPADRYPSAAAFRDALADWLFATSARVSAPRLARFVDSVHENASEQFEARVRAEGLPAEVEFVDVATISGANTKAAKLEAEQAAAVGRALFESRGGDAAAAAVSSDAGLAADDIPIVFDDEPLGGIDPVGATGRPTADPLDGAYGGPAPSLALAPFVDAGQWPPRPLAPRAAARASSTPPVQSGHATTVPLIAVPAEAPDSHGDFASGSALALLYRIAGYQMDGLLVVERDGVVKEAYFADGNPQFVRSSDPGERFGEHLVAKQVITREELHKALSLLGHFGGRLGDTLVGLRLLKPLDAFRHLTHQVRDKLVDVATWTRGRHRWYSRRANPWPSLPLHLNTLEIMGAGAARLEPEFVWGWAQSIGSFRPGQSSLVTADLACFGLGSRVAWVHERCDGNVAVRDMLTWFSAHDQIQFLRVLHLLVQVEAVRLK